MGMHRALLPLVASVFSLAAGAFVSQTAAGQLQSSNGSPNSPAVTNTDTGVLGPQGIPLGQSLGGSPGMPGSGQSIGGSPGMPNDGVTNGGSPGVPSDQSGSSSDQSSRGSPGLPGDARYGH
jgi:hypothetical protein